MLNSGLVDSAPAWPSKAMPSSSVARIAWPALVCATLYVCYFSHLGAIGFVGPDEPRYAWIARDMAESGDWITPRLYGKPWFEKPPLYYWSAALSFKLFGVSEAAARLPSAVAALLATLALAWLTLRLYGAETARWLLLLLPTSVAMIGFSHAASTDMLFSATLTLALVAAATILRLTTPPALVAGQLAAPDVNRAPLSGVLCAALFGSFLGLAVLAKGPAALILSGGAVFFWALFTKRWRDAFRLLHPAAIAAFCLTALPWYILCARRNPDFFHIFIIEHNFKRFLTPEFQHIQPFWYYAAVLLIALLPWTALLLWSAVTGAVHLWRARTISAATCFLLCWAGFCVLFFSISKSKLPGYILPAMPVIVLLMTQAWFVLAERVAKSLSLTLLSAALFFAACFALTESVASQVSRGNINFGIAAGLVFGVLSVANLVFAVGLRSAGNKAAAVAACCVLPVLLAVMTSNKYLSSIFYWDPSGRSLAQELRQRQIPATELAVQTMSRAQRYSLSFYLHTEIAGWDRQNSRAGYLLAGSRMCASIIGQEFKCEEIPFDLQKTGFFLYRITPQLAEDHH
jgi:4-amino-4-deoxy-L-arabinose transferase-like glycosyltransferase